MVPRRALVALAFFLELAKTEAHPIPTMEVEALFHRDRSCEVKVNFDPRLFLHAVPSTLPPVPGSWWWDQSPSERTRTEEKAREYLARNLRFQAGPSPLQPDWEVLAIDSTLATPLAPTSAEVHLLARSKIRLPEPPGDFKLALDRAAAIPLILLNSEEGNPKPVPQSVYPGESSRAFSPTLPTAAPSSPASVMEKPTEAPISTKWRYLLAAALFACLILVVISQRRAPAGKSTTG